ncbi:Hypothetical predicted protein [Podarcis lilfordi]|uniref:Uncharacterized protein n=1 Tax=Podarcis lilfordi TaxID=74358 RepID=A0AA35KZ51_9SAUR|nr:Hypothetical predicted protein [Podarcis lilfordi]
MWCLCFVSAPSQPSSSSSSSDGEAPLDQPRRPRDESPLPLVSWRPQTVSEGEEAKARRLRPEGRLDRLPRKE